ncbi:MAG TPA: hypothetical protein PLX89_27445, partial [Verrucomicrobiota bacterium]|nr:hypothetical protein [Verrucomicrobiota bacterium]
KVAGKRVVEDLRINRSIYRPQRPGYQPPTEPVDPSVFSEGGVQVLNSYEGINFLSSDCGCLPPDTGAAVGNNYIIETVNTHIRIFEKSTGTILRDESLGTFFGNPSSGDPYVVYDDIVDRWYVVAFNGGATGLQLAVSNTGNPMDGFLPTYNLTDVGGFPDYPKMGFNQDAIFISYNDFGGGSAAATIATVDKTAALAGSLVYYVAVPAFQFRAMPPAQMHGDTTGGVQWFVSTDGGDFEGDNIRVTKMEGYLSGSPTFTYWAVPVIHYQAPVLADQPGGSVAIFPNTTTTQVHYRNGHLVTAMSSGQAADGYVYPKGLYYQVDVSGGTPTLLQEGVIDPGPGVAVQMPSADEDTSGNLGLTWMQSSVNEYLSMWVGSVDSAGNVGATVAAPGGGFFYYSFRIGDYSTVVLDPTDGKTFWAANEYIGNDGDFDIWKTHITSFSLGMAVVATSPANGEFVSSPPIEYVVRFSAPYDPTSVDGSDLLVNGIPASSFTLTDASTISFAFTTSPVSSQGLQALQVPEGAVTRLSDGDPVAAYNSTFWYDAVRLEVVSTVPADGTIATLPLKSLVVNLNEDCDPASVSTADLVLSVGSVSSAQLVNARSVKFGLTGIVQEGTLSFRLPAGAFTDPYGNPSKPYEGTVVLDYRMEPFPVPTLAVDPAGGLIYETSFRGNISPTRNLPGGDTDIITLDVDPGQTITVIVTPEDPTLRPKVTLAGNGLTTATATAPALNKRAVIQTRKAAGALWAQGPTVHCTVTVAGAGLSYGHYSVQLVLNAAAELEEYDGPANDSLATAQNIEGSFITLGTGTPKPERGAAFGSAATGALPGDVFVSVRSFGTYGGSVVRFDAAGDLAQTISSPEFDRGIISDVELGPGNVIYVALSTLFLEDRVMGEILKFDLAGNFLGSIALPDDPAERFYFYPFGFDVAADGTLWVPQLNSGNVIHVDSTGGLIASYPVGLQPQDASVTPSGLVLISFFDFDTAWGSVLQLDPATGSVTELVPFLYSPVDINATPDGGSWLGDFYDSLRFDSAGGLNQVLYEYGSLDPQEDPSNNVWIAAFFNGVAKYNPAGEFLFRRFTPGGDALGLAVAGVDSPDPLPPPAADYYLFKLRAGQSASVVGSLLGGSPLSIELLNSADVVLADGVASKGNDCLLQDVVVAADGDYFIKVTGNGKYSLVVTRNASFDNGVNGSLATAQSLAAPSSNSPHRVLGVLNGGSVDFSAGFANPEGLTANGTSYFVDGLARLTQGAFSEAGSIFTTDQVNVSGFTTTFTFQIYPGTWPMADGLTFTIQGNAATDLSYGGGGLGYGLDYPDGITRGIRNSVAIKFDLYNNAGEGINSTGLFTDGRSPTVPEDGSGDVLVNLDGTGIDLHSLNPLQVDMAYDGSVLTVTVTDLVTLASAVQTYVVDIPAQIGGGTGYVGFTGGTG